MTQHGPRHFREETFNEIEPGAVLRSENEREAAFWLSRKPRLGLLGDVRTVVVEDQLDRRVGGISGVEPLEEADELTRPMAILDAGVHLAGEQVDPGEQAERAVALVFMIARDVWTRSRPQRQVRRGVADRLDARL